MCVYSQPRPPCQPKMMRMTNLVDVLFPSFRCVRLHMAEGLTFIRTRVYTCIYIQYKYLAFRVILESE